MMDQNKPAPDFAEVERLVASHQLGELRSLFKTPAPLIRRSITRSVICMILVPPGLLIWMTAIIVVLNLLAYIHIIWLVVILFLIGMSIYIIPLCYGIISFKSALDELLRCKRLKKEQIC